MHLTLLQSCINLNDYFSDQPDSSVARPGSPNTSYPSNGYPPNRLDSTDVGVRRPRPHDVWVITPLFINIYCYWMGHFLLKGISLFYTWYLKMKKIPYSSDMSILERYWNYQIWKQWDRVECIHTHNSHCHLIGFLGRFASASFLRINKRIIIFPYWTVGLVTGGQNHLLIGKVLSVQCLGFAHPMA